MTAPTLTEIKNYLRYESADTSNDTALGIIIAGAQRWVENYTGHLLTEREVTETPLALGLYHDLRWKPYVADSLTLTVLDVDYADDDTYADFAVYQVHGVHRIAPNAAWPTTYGGYLFTYTAGYETQADIPQDLLLAVAVMAAMTDEDRGDQSSQGWKSVYALLEQYRLPALA